jgi:hypothetical protein
MDSNSKNIRNREFNQWGRSGIVSAKIQFRFFNSRRLWDEIPEQELVTNLKLV